LAAIEEAIAIGETNGVPVHIAHIKALGVDVWGQSVQAVGLIEAARARGVSVTADQYPWAASGTRISNALMPNWAKDGGTDALRERLRDPSLSDRLHDDITENLRRRGGADALLIVSGVYTNKTLAEASQLSGKEPVELAQDIVLDGDARVASFNMNDEDIEHFMVQPWVMTSSDGTRGHPRKFASFPRKFETYVRGRSILEPGDFLYRSSGLVATTFEICERGFLRKGYYADIVVLDPDEYAARANYQQPELFAQGVRYLFVNGQMEIQQGQRQKLKAGLPLRRNTCP
ncbi:MAG: D-aminoacylase, partial [Pseudomonadota bacterium]